MGKRNVNITLQERHINWMLNCHDPTPLAFFQCIFPAHRNKASEKYHKILDLALGETDDEEILNKLKKMKEMVDEKKMLRDWESWMQQKTAILIRRNVRKTHMNLHKEISSMTLNKDVNEIEEFFISKDNDGKVYRDDIGDGDNFIERTEENQPTTRRSWVSIAVPTLAYWNILDLTEDTQIKSLFSTDDWEEINESFKKDVKLDESDIPNVVEYFFDEVEKITKKDDEYIINAIDGLTPEMIEKNRKVKFSDEEKEIFNGLRRAVITYAENLKDLEVPMSEADFDNSFPNMLTKRFLNKRDLKMDVGEIACWASARRRNEGRSIVLRARIGQKCDFRGTLKNSINNLEAIIGLRSGGLPVAHRKKVHEDRADLSVAMRDVLYNFFKTNPNASGNDLHSTYVLGIQSWGWIHETYGMDCKATNVERLGRLSQKKMPNTLKTLAILEGFYAT
ncbi:8595_t:CDS:2, partial [Diversispora eburnea]